MQISPVVTLILSIVFGAAAILGARLWLGSSSKDDAELAEQAAAPVETVTQPVLVAVRDIPRGVVLDPAWFEIAQREETLVPLGSFESFKALELSGESRRTLVSLEAGQLLVEDMLLAPGMRASMSTRIEPGYRAFTVRTTDVSGVGGFVLPGDRVDVIFTENSDPQGSAANLVSKILAQNVEVLGVDLNDDMTGENPGVFKTATLSVTLDQAQQLSVASQRGLLSFALRGSADEEFLQADAVTLGAEKEARPKQVASAAPRPAPRIATSPASATIEVILGEETSSHVVPSSR
ncbi:Flp pilus assembly protein CpaB [Henriciella litoralis]|uniref:Flp pilus assembly protein CpaB n=1 Tax=Henriciella litoralis TaxID=568102 RepID=UPI000A05CBEF|nr:Flp pilus assembly protein CpaB [Henriciella litoralis]